METLEFKYCFPLEVIKTEGAGEITGKNIEATVTTFGNKDVVNDVIEKGALDKFLKKFDKSLPMLLNHDTSLIIGKWDRFEKNSTGV